MKAMPPIGYSYILGVALKTKLGKSLEVSYGKLYVSIEKSLEYHKVQNFWSSSTYLVDLVDKVLPVPALELSMVSTLS